MTVQGMRVQTGSIIIRQLNKQIKMGGNNYSYTTPSLKGGSEGQ